MPNQQGATPPGGGETVECPVCRMEIDPEEAPASLEHGGETFRFCNLRCRDRFLARPGFFLKGRRGTAAPRPLTAG
ncbi:MAG: YHS domain-containing protein [Planctomycetaceae bacterium]|nr:YHS domain-containing protein [Planctomycetota bacterium]NUN53263.1 YHS domain-containing protein [Planctomycetaceae bacterium]